MGKDPVLSWRYRTSERQAARLPPDGPLSVVRANEVTVVGREGSPVQDGSAQDGSDNQPDPVQGPEPEGLAQDPASLADVYGQAVRDVTTQGDAVADVRNTSDLQRIEERLAQSVAALELANQELEAFHDALTHDLRSPLLVVTNFAQQLRETLGDSLGEREADDLEESAFGTQAST